MTLQPDSDAGKIRRELDSDPYRTNREISESIGKVKSFRYFESEGVREIQYLLSPSYISVVRRKFKYPKASDPRPTAQPEMPVEAYAWI